MLHIKGYINFNRIATWLMTQATIAYKAGDFDRLRNIHKKLDRLYEAWGKQTVAITATPESFRTFMNQE